MHEQTEHKVYYFTSPDDLEKCYLKTNIVQLAENIRTAKWMRSKNLG